MSHAPSNRIIMLEACAQTHQENDSSFNCVMSEKIHVGPFPCKIETSVKSVTLLTDMESDKDLFESLCADDSIPEGAEFQILCAVCAVLVGQVKSHRIEVECKYQLTLVVLLLLRVKNPSEVCPSYSSCACSPCQCIPCPFRSLSCI